MASPGMEMVEHIEETLKLDLHSIEEDYAHQNAEYRLGVMQRALVGFVRTFADKHTVSEEEDRYLAFTVAMELLKSFESETVSNLLRRRLMDQVKLERGG